MLFAYCFIAEETKAQRNKQDKLLQVPRAGLLTQMLLSQVYALNEGCGLHSLDFLTV